MYLIPAFELGRILLAENDYIIGMQHKITTQVHAKTGSGGKHDLLFLSFDISIHLLLVHLFCCLHHRQAAEATKGFRKIYRRRI